VRAIIIGGGEVGQNVAATLVGERHEVIVVESDPDRAAMLETQMDALVVTGNGGSPRLLQEIGAAKADLLLAVTHIDEVNIIAALAGHQLGVPRTVARVRDDDYFGSTDAFSRDVLGIDFVINPERATADAIAAAILLPGAVHVDFFADGLLAIAEVVLRPGSPAVGALMAEVQTSDTHFVVGVVRDGDPVGIENGARLAAGDHLLVGASRQRIAASVALLAGKAKKAEDTVLFGAGKINYHLARRLERHHLRLRVLERDAARARWVAERLPQSEVIHEEGVGKEALLAHGVDTAGAFVASSGDDRANLLAALYAQQLGADLCLPVVSREEFMPLVGALGIDTAFSPRLITAEAIVRFLRGDHVLGVHALPGGSELLELKAGDRSAITGRSAGDAGLPGGCVVASIVRGGEVLVPCGTEVIQPSDRVLVVAAKAAVAGTQRAFKSPA
jgi:trk system potassium uptake protein TrkA